MFERRRSIYFCHSSLVENAAHLKTWGACRVVNKHEPWATCADTFQGCAETDDVSQEDADTAAVRRCRHRRLLNDSDLDGNSCSFTFTPEMWSPVRWLRERTLFFFFFLQMHIMVAVLFTSIYPYVVKWRFCRTNLRPICFIRNLFNSERSKGFKPSN